MVKSTIKSIATEHHSFKTIYSIRYWNDPDDNEKHCASVAVFTFRGIKILSDFSTNIVGGRLQEYQVVWPVSLTVSDQLDIDRID